MTSSLLVAAFSSLGPCTAADLMSDLGAADRQSMIQELRQHAPAALADCDKGELRRGALDGAIDITNLFQGKRLVGLDYELVMIEALASSQFKGKAVFMPPEETSPDDLARMRTNVPRGLDVFIPEPGWGPVHLDPRRDIVVATAFSAGPGYALVRSQTARLLKMIAGLPFAGETVAWRPLPAMISDQPRGWVTVLESQLFRHVVPFGSIPPHQEE